MPLILYIDTSGAKSHSLLFDEHAIHAERVGEEVNAHAKMLNVQIDEMLKDKNWAWQQINAVMVMNGPGSYTGLRISLANAKGYCYALDIPLILISQFELMRASISSDVSFPIFILKARENEFFVNYSEKGKEVNRIMTYEDLKQFASSSQAILYSTDSRLADDFLGIEILNICNEQIQSVGIDYAQSNRFFNLIDAEPFYMKDVYLTNC